MEVSVTAHLSGAELSGLDNEHLMPALQMCLLTGGDHDTEILTGAPLACVPDSGLVWTVTAESSTSWELYATLRTGGNSSALPAADYTLVAILNDPGLQALFGPRAAIELRSTALKIVAAPASGEDEQLSHLLRRGARAEANGEWTEAINRANEVLAIYPKSAMALCLRGNAQRELEQVTQAIASYSEGRAILQANEDTRTPLFADAQVRADRTLAIDDALDEMATP